MHSPTKKTYGNLDDAYDFFNSTLFDDTLPKVLIVTARQRHVLGHYGMGRWEERNGAVKFDEISLNPEFFKERTLEETLSTLVHEMVHLWQATQDKPAQNGYHCKFWGRKMESIGLIPSDTGKEGGVKTGVAMSHYIEEGGLFQSQCAVIIRQGFILPYVATLVDTRKAKKLAGKKRASKTKYTCPVCSINAWGKEGLLIICGECSEHLI